MSTKTFTAAALGLLLSAGACAVEQDAPTGELDEAAANLSQVTLDLRPYTDAPASNHANPYDGFGYLQSALLDRVHADVEDALDGGSTAPVDQLADAAWRGVNQSPSGWDIICVCVTGQGCPCKDLIAILGGVPPEELDADIHQMLAAQPAQRPTRSQILASARANLRLANPTAVARAYDDMMALVEAVSRGTLSRESFQRQIELLEWSWSTGMSGDDRAFLLQSGAMARHIVQYAGFTGSQPQAAECVDYAILGAALGGWGGALIVGGGCVVSKLPWYPE